MNYRGLLVFLLLSATRGQAQSALGAVNVTAMDSQGTPVPGAVIHYQRIARMSRNANGRFVAAPGEAVASGKGTADASGSASFPNLPAGDYALCAEVPSAAYLNPCKWSGAVRLTVPGNALVRQDLRLTRGVWLNVQSTIVLRCSHRQRKGL